MKNRVGKRGLSIRRRNELRGVSVSGRDFTLRYIQDWIVVEASTAIELIDLNVHT